jgi:hypothetical protein
MSKDFGLPRHYYVDESDPDILVLRRQDGSYVAAFSAQAATREGIVEAAQEDYQTLQRQLADEHEAGDTDRDA